MSFERTLEWKGETLRIIEWSHKMGIDYKILVARLNAGWDAERALTKPVRGWHQNKDKKDKIPEAGLKEESSHRSTFIDVEYGDYGKY